MVRQTASAIALNTVGGTRAVTGAVGPGVPWPAADDAGRRSCLARCTSCGGGSQRRTEDVFRHRGADDPDGSGAVDRYVGGASWWRTRLAGLDHASLRGRFPLAARSHGYGLV